MFRSLDCYKIKAVLKKLLKIFLCFVLLIVVGLFVFYLYLASFDGGSAKDYPVFDNPTSRPFVFAHRGGAGIAPENTIAAFQKSADLGVDFLELDIHATKDGELVVFHDRSVDRTTDGKGLLAEKTLEELKQLDAGYNWTNDGGKTFPFRGKGVVIPTLREVFEKFPIVKINIEPKHSAPSPVEILCDLIREYNRTDKVIVASTRGSFMEKFRNECSEVATSASPAEAVGFLVRYKVGLSDNYTPKMSALQTIPTLKILDVVTPGYLKAADAKNLQVHVWTINETEEMKRLAELGVDGIMTDYPDKLLKILNEQN